MLCWQPLKFDFPLLVLTGAVGLALSLLLLHKINPGVYKCVLAYKYSPCAYIKSWGSRVRISVATRVREGSGGGGTLFLFGLQVPQRLLAVSALSPPVIVILSSLGPLPTGNSGAHTTPVRSEPCSYPGFVRVCMCVCEEMDWRNAVFVLDGWEWPCLATVTEHNQHAAIHHSPHTQKYGVQI